MDPALQVLSAVMLAALPPGVPTPPDAFAPAPPLSEPAGAADCLEPPDGSLSFGYAGGGELRGATSLPLHGDGWRFLGAVARRGTHWGTDEVDGFVRRVGRAVSDAHPGAEVRVGNVSVRDGGRTRWHVSHQSGRDVDLLPFAVDRAGAPVDPGWFVPFGPDGRSTRPRGRYRFDVARNFTLVRALLTDPDARVQWIFVAEWLKTLLLEEAEARGAEGHLVERMEAVLHQPSDSNPHADHFHVRLYCSVEDRLHGCLDPPPHWPWIDRGEARYARRVDELRQLLRSADAGLRAKAATTLGHIRAAPAVRALLGRLHDGDESVRAAALQSIRDIGAPSALPGLLRAVHATPDPRWGAALFDALGSLRGDGPRRVSLDFLRHPSSYVHPARADAPLSDLRVTAARVLGRRAHLEAVPVLLEQLTSRSRRVRRAAERALARATNHVRRGETAWRELWDAHRDDPWLTWVERGLTEAGYELSGAIDEHAIIPDLIEASGDRRPHISQNAVRALSRITGHAVDPFARSPRGLRRHWQSWWSDHGRSQASR